GMRIPPAFAFRAPAALAQLERSGLVIRKMGAPQSYFYLQKYPSESELCTHLTQKTAAPFYFCHYPEKNRPAKGICLQKT
ncbi:MAG: hypothetical protein KGZ25_05430, partial [Planctomycetes bacterium]|nr:hypothetical protein [Planctomycetota bacterium]